MPMNHKDTPGRKPRVTIRNIMQVINSLEAAVERNTQERNSLEKTSLEKGSSTVNAQLQSSVDEVSKAIISLQRMQEIQERKTDRMLSVLGGDRGRITPQRLQRSPLGRYLNLELQKHLRFLNAFGRRGAGLGRLAGLGGASGGLLSTAMGAAASGASRGFLALLMKPLLAVLGVGAATAAGVALMSGSNEPKGGPGSKYEASTSGEISSKARADLSKYDDRGSKNVNPGNVKGSGYLGQVGNDEKNHAIFATKEAGVAGIVDRLYRYNKENTTGRDYLAGKDTIRKIMYTYAPPSDNNNTEAYIRDISKELGIAPNQKIDFKKNPELLEPFVNAIMRNESPGYRAYSKEEIRKGIEIGRDSALLGKEESARIHAAYLSAPARKDNTVDTLPGEMNKDLWQQTQENRGATYRLGGKSTSTGIDCSGWVQTAMKKAGVPDNIMDQVMHKTAAEQIINTGRSTNTLRETNDLLGSDLKEGMLVGLKNNRSRAMGIGHVGIIVKNPETGELGVSHASTSRGIVWEPIDKFDRWARNEGGYVLSDPMAASRELKKQEKKEEDSLAAKPETNTAPIVQALSEPSAQGTTQEGGIQQPSSPNLTASHSAEQPVAQLSTQPAPELQAPIAASKEEVAPALQAPTPIKDTPSSGAQANRAQQEEEEPLSDGRVNRNNAQQEVTPPVQAATNEGGDVSGEVTRRGRRASLLESFEEEDGEDHDGDGFIGVSKRVSQESLSAPSSKGASVTPSLQGARANSVQPQVAQPQPNASVQQPIKAPATPASAPVAPAPVQVPMAANASGNAPSAGTDIPFTTDSQAVLAFQLDPTSPIHA